MEDARRKEEDAIRKAEYARRKELYDAVLNEHWTTMAEKLTDETDSMRWLQPISMHKDNIIHLAVHSKKKEPLEKILKSVKSDMLPEFTSSVNAYGNTVLHEAAICRNFEAVKLLVEKNNELLEMKNDSGETPLFRAAAFGNTKIVKYLAAPRDQRVIGHDRYVQLKSIHRNKNNGDSILLAAIQGQHFGTALELLVLDETLAELEYKSGSSLYMLAKLTSVFKSRKEMGTWKKIFYFCVPIGCGLDDSTEKINNEDEDPDIEIGLREGLPTGRSHHAIEIENGEGGPIYKVLYKIYVSFWNMLMRLGWYTVIHKLWQEKRNYNLARQLAQKLIEEDKSWDQSEMQFGTNRHKPPGVENEEKKGEENCRNPLLTAIRTGNEELVKLILEQHPQALEYINHKKQNILHIAVMYRQREIFDHVRKKEVPMVRLARQIDANGYTTLHSAADTKYYKGGRNSGPAYQLQEELEWFYDVEKIMPSYYQMLPANNNMTPWDVFVEHHDKLHKDAQQWIKDTSQSCSTVAVLVTTAVFAAAFTVPGGTNTENGRPVLLNSPFFVFFTIADIISLSSSLTAIVMFLAILTSPLGLKNFYTTLPQRLTIGFALLFVSVATTMVAFASTIFLIIRLDQRQQWTTTLICSAAFLPVTVLALTQFPLFASFTKVWNFFSKFVRSNLVVHPQKLRRR